MKFNPLFNRFACLLLLALPRAQAAVPSVAVSSIPAPAIKPAVSGDFFNFEGTPNLDGVRADQGAALSVTTQNGASAIRVDIPASSGYPGITFPAPEGGWDLSDYAGVQLDLTNPGAEDVAMTLRVENAGDRAQSPWSVQVFRIKPGKTETLKVVFGQSFGGRGFPLDKAHVTAIKLYPNPPKAPFSVLLGNIKAFKSAAAAAPASDETAVVTPEPALPPAPPVFPPLSLIHI